MELGLIALAFSSLPEQSRVNMTAYLSGAFRTSRVEGGGKKRMQVLEKIGDGEKRDTEDEMVGRHHRLNGHEFEQALGDSEGQGKLACYSLQGGKESDMT